MLFSHQTHFVRHWDHLDLLKYSFDPFGSGFMVGELGSQLAGQTNAENTKQIPEY